MVRAGYPDTEEVEDEVDTDSDYEEEPTTSPVNAQVGGSAKEDNTLGHMHKLLPGAFMT